MKNVNLVRSILFIAVLTISVGCSKGGSSDSSSTRGPLNVVYRNGSNVSGMSAKVSTMSEDNVPLFFDGTVEITGFNYRPGETVQAHGVSDYAYADWSQWEILTRINDKPFVVLPGSDIDVTARQGNRIDATWTSYPDFVTQVGAFRLDVIQIHAGNVGIINAGNYVCGYNSGGMAPADLSRFRSLGLAQNVGDGQECAVSEIDLGSDNTPMNQSDVWFVRNDWFSTPVQVYVGSATISGANSYFANGVGFTTDSVITNFQAEIIGSLLSGSVETQPGGHYFGSYISIVPQTGDPQTIQLTDGKTVTDPTMTTGGETVPTQLTHLAKSIQINVDVNLVPSMIQNASQLNVSTGSFVPLLVDRDANGVPWGLAASFQTVTPAVSQ